jgi:ribonuclease P protein component
VKLGKAARLRRRREFVAVQERGKRLYARELVVLSLPGIGSKPRIGITVPGRIGNAVERNRIKRWIREAFRKQAGGMPAVDLVVIARSGAGRLGFEGVRAALLAAGRKLRGATP